MYGVYEKEIKSFTQNLFKTENETKNENQEYKKSQKFFLLHVKRCDCLPSIVCVCVYVLN